ncbi:hypothetical protein D3C59_20125 [Streptomyces sp. SHP22-7]|nr:hypothetical protein D3C59_20125 [Streptomyces sp. SHP22-7]
MLFSSAALSCAGAWTSLRQRLSSTSRLGETGQLRLFLLPELVQGSKASTVGMAVHSDPDVTWKGSVHREGQSCHEAPFS